MTRFLSVALVIVLAVQVTLTTLRYYQMQHAVSTFNYWTAEVKHHQELTVPSESRAPNKNYLDYHKELMGLKAKSEKKMVETQDALDEAARILLLVLFAAGSWWFAVWAVGRKDESEE